MSDTSHFNFVISLEKLDWRFTGTDNDTGEKIYIKKYATKSLSDKEYQLRLSDTMASYLFRNSLGITRIELTKDYGFDSGFPTSIPYVYAKHIMEEMELLENELLKANIPFSKNYFNSRKDKSILNEQIRQKFNLSELEDNLEELKKKEQMK